MIPYQANLQLYHTKECLTHLETLVIPLYKEDVVPTEVCTLLKYDPSNNLDLDYGCVNATLTMQTEIMKRIIFLGLGIKNEMTRQKLRRAIAKAIRVEKKDVCIWLDTLQKTPLGLETAAYDIVFGIEYVRYSYLSKEKMHISYASDNVLEKVLNKAMIIVNCINHARTLGNSPSNIMTPENLAKEARTFAIAENLTYEILTNKELEELGAGALLGVNQGSLRGARLIVLRYQGNMDAPYTALIGKGITFDSGGYNLKKSSSMHGMKLDMCGGANVLGAFEAIVRTKQKVNVMALIAATENVIGPNSYTCDNVLKSLSGKTIEITNTDAEGRLILCDAISYAQQHGAKRIIDVATLTGAVVTALGYTYTGAFTNSDTFLMQLKKATEITEEKIWQLPLDNDFHMQIRKSNVADMTNAVPDAKGGSSLAAAFLEEFIEDDVEWIHLDIAGTSEHKEDDGYVQRGATGVMIESLATMFEIN